MKADLIQAIQKNDAASAKQLISEHPHLAKAKTDNGVSVLLLAAYYRNDELVDFLLENRKELDVFEAAATGRLDGLKEQLNVGNVNDFSADGFSALGLACFFGHLVIAEYLIKKGADVDLPSNNDFKVAPIHSAAAIGRVDIVKLLLQNGVNVNAQQQSGVTALHSAAHNNNLELVKLLLANGADRKLQMTDGKTALQMAEVDGHEAVIRVLKA